MTSPSDAGVLIAGGGLAAQRTCERLRSLGYDGTIRIVCDEPHAPYNRPPLSKALLTGARPIEPPSLRPERWYDDHAVELLLGVRAAGLDTAERRVVLADGRRLRYDELVIATGSRPRRLPVLPIGERIRELRTIEDARALRALLASGLERLAIVGAGLVGMEVASSATSVGIPCTLIEAARAPLARVLPPTLAMTLVDLHRRAGVEVLLERTVTAARNTAACVELTLSNGQRIDADAVVVATGAVPATEWLAASRLSVEGAVRVDAYGRTGVGAVHAAGDAACFPDPASGHHVPTPHWEAAAHQGAAVAHAIVGVPAPAAPPHMFWSDQHGVRLQFVGRADRVDAIELDGDASAGDSTAWILAAGRPVAALLTGRPRALPEVRRRLAQAAILADLRPAA